MARTRPLARDKIFPALPEPLPLARFAAAGLVCSQALLRLSISRSGPIGLMCIGTRRPDTFHPGLGSELLTFLARVLGIAIAQWLERGR